MKKPNFSAAFKTWAAVLFCAFFAFFTPVSAQNEVKKKAQQIKEFRTYCVDLLNALPAASQVQTAAGLSQTDKQKILSVINILKEASQIKDNASDATFSLLQKNVEGVESWLETFGSTGVVSAARANDSPQESPLDKCRRGCRETLDAANQGCAEQGLEDRDRRLCRARALNRWFSCTLNCHFN